ncbi:MAG: hypothetical protein WDL87_06495 [Candidatus Omnitrophota bacterium]
MALSKALMPICNEIFSIPGILKGPFLMFGYQVFDASGASNEFEYKDVKELLVAKGVSEISTLDYFDERADLKYDMNLPVPREENEKYNVVFDIGCLEHVFDTRQCIENCLRMVKVGGAYVLVTAVNGFFGHGLHVLNPVAIRGALESNNFQVIYLKFSTVYGNIIKDPARGEDIVIWIVAKKLKSIGKFVIPQQQTSDEPQNPIDKMSRKQVIAQKLKRLVTVFLRYAWELLLDIRYGVRQAMLKK